jgi:hypothetical protein
MCATSSGKREPKAAEETPSAFSNVKGQIGYCGLWCGSCSVGNGALNDLARKTRKTIVDYGLRDWGPRDVDYEGLLKGLATVGSTKPCVGCLMGGGRTNCEMRDCAKRRGLAECADCGEQESCRNKKILQHMRSGGQRVGMKVKRTAGNQRAQLEKWMSSAKP